MLLSNFDICDRQIWRHASLDKFNMCLYVLYILIFLKGVIPVWSGLPKSLLGHHRQIEQSVSPCRTIALNWALSPIWAVIPDRVALSLKGAWSDCIRFFFKLSVILVSEESSYFCHYGSLVNLTELKNVLFGRY